ncbi:MAG: cbb3-type cytochrome oxidase assembly protein CcoS [Bdellovibrio sp.]|nr:MAG: cbb3-type cytochrome oxidase assembly protein CcoS [Bdellovibrio sp.]
MSVLLLLIPFSLLMGGLFLWLFFMAVKKDQFDDLVTPAHRMLLEDETIQQPSLNRKDSNHAGTNHLR